MDKIEFLKARLDEREAVAREAAEHTFSVGTHEAWNVVEMPYEGISVWGRPGGLDDEGGKSEVTAHMQYNDPAFVLAEIAAQRAIIELHSAAMSRFEGPYCSTCGDPDGWDQTPPVDWPCETITALLQPFAGRDDFPKEWKA